MMFLRERCRAEPLEFLEYIQGAPDQQFINTGVAVNYSDAEIECKWAIWATDGVHINYVPIFGNYVDESTPVTRLILRNTDAHYRLNFNNPASNSISTGSFEFNVGRGNPNTIILSRQKYSINTNAFTISPSGLSYTNDSPMQICGARGYTFDDNATYRIQIYYFKIRRGSSTLLGDFVPCRRGSSVGMYDRVSDRFLDNSGVGSFVAGPVI